MTKLHYIYDEELKVEREYEEADRKAVVGDYVYLNNVERAVLTQKVDYDSEGLFLWGDYSTLSPTGNVRIDGELFKLADRSARVGERIIIVNAFESHGKYENGGIFTVESVEGLGVCISEVVTESDGGNPGGYVFHHVFHREYLVLEPVEPEKEAESPQSVEDLIANLARRVNELEAQLAAVSTLTTLNKRNIETFAEDFTEDKAKTDETLEMLTDDIVTLDERTQADTLTDIVERELALRMYRGGRCACRQGCR